MMECKSEKEIRLECLRFAYDLRQPRNTTEDLIASAESFYSFCCASSAKPAAVKTPKKATAAKK